MDKASVVRVLALVASLLALVGVNVPETTIELISMVVVGVVGLYTAYKNNYLFSRGRAQKDILQMTKLYEKNK